MSIKNISEKALLIILDGFGISENTEKNAIRDAKTPILDGLFKDYPYTTIQAGGVLVGLPKGVVGNSEVGHMNLGAGRAIRQDLVRINESIKNHTFGELPKLKELIDVAKKNNNRIHLMGLLSDGGIHSHIEHTKEIIKCLRKEGIEVFLHAFMDGRDTPPACGDMYLKEIVGFEGSHFASMQGRSIGMDRDRRWEKIKKAYDMFLGHGDVTDLSPLDYLNSEYEAGRTDEFVAPALFNKDYAIKEEDCVFFTNYRPDRAIQLTMAFNYPEFTEFERPFFPAMFLCMTPFIPDEMELPILFDKEKLQGTMTEYLSSIGKKQLKIAETEKYAHVTFFFNGGEKKPFPNEEHFLIPSPKEVSTYDEKPQMSAPEVTEQLIAKLSDFDFSVVNFANSDMVGHTGKYEAAVKAIEALDECVGKLVEKCLAENITIVITADHGNSDQMTHKDGTPHTAHTGAPVPFCVVNSALKDKAFTIAPGDHSLMDVSPTCLYIMGIDRPASFTGHHIFE